MTKPTTDWLTDKTKLPDAIAGFSESFVDRLLSLGTGGIPKATGNESHRATGQRRAKRKVDDEMEPGPKLSENARRVFDRKWNTQF